MVETLPNHPSTTNPNVSGSVKVSCGTQPHESTMVQEILFAVRHKENICREQLAWHGLKQDGSLGGHLRACSPDCGNKQAARNTTLPKPESRIRLEEGRSLALVETTNAKASTNNARYVGHWVGSRAKNASNAKNNCHLLLSISGVNRPDEKPNTLSPFDTKPTDLQSWPRCSAV